MKTPRIPYGRQSIGNEEVRAVSAVLRSDFLTQGPKVGEFEKKLATRVGAQYAVALANGTAALHGAASAIGLGPGDEVITTPISFLATSNAVLYAGAKPVFVDIDPITKCLDANLIEKKITQRSRAIFVTDFAGHPADLRTIWRIAKKYGLKVVEDACHALGASYEGRPVGSGRYSDLTVFSFHPVKHITTGEGGAVTTNSQAYFKKICEFRTHGVTKDPAKLHDRKQGAWYYEMQSLGFNYRLTDIQAAIGIEQLKKLSGFVARRRVIADRYRAAFRDLDGVEMPQELPRCKHAYHLFVMCLCGRWVKNRFSIFRELQEQGIGVQVHYIPIPLQPFYKKLGYKAVDYPEAQAYYRSAISLPIYPAMRDADVQRVISVVRRVIQRY